MELLEEADAKSQPHNYEKEPMDEPAKYVGGPYDVYLRVNYFPFIDIPPGKLLHAQHRQWHGSPTAMIMHAMRNLTRGDGWMTMSRLIKRQLDELQYLWSREPEAKASSLPMISNPSSTSSPRTTDKPASGQKSGPEDVRKETSHREVSWQWGPASSSNDAILLLSNVEERCRVRRESQSSRD
ncbi:hypothetical protein AOL_s00079g265 [Orbilia oligospora ATCC 24927]|uniref:Uncharacterized protein n=1 Tax=Arthrobotrys oligospora (strain ATCC 24927 / CBS 115.81 / DSM 1491) TaxID=756982 RepID=G1XCU5_ARTOA|nr:hypothetical protein AOL_s00079g265 [Orbilia oligospora ATCC 24927]EGX49044.1 hypothetical protein AOL_s00079g265 [Orbilia oligospora ATCC 24927]